MSKIIKLFIQAIIFTVIIFIILNKFQQKFNSKFYKSRSNNNVVIKRLESNRKPEYKVLDLIIDRWSPKDMSGENISKDELMSLFEAAKWAPSSWNNQPWRFIYVKKDSDMWPKALELIVPANQEWAKNAAALILVLSYKLFDHNKKSSKTHSFDTGAAVQNLALQGHSMGLVVHEMEGFDYAKAKKLFSVPDDYEVEVLIAVGKPAQNNWQNPEIKSDRKKIKDFVFKDQFGKN